MIIPIDNHSDIDTDKDLSSAERHILQKLFGWKTMVDSVEQFQLKKKEAFQAGWNNSGPIRENKTMAIITREMEKEVRNRLKSC